MDSGAPQYRCLISIATYRRPDELRRLLDSLAVSIDESADVVVVDNDPAGSARPVVESHALPIRYELEPTAGIASARNRGMALFSSEYDAVIFVDDDEWVSPDWYTTLTSYARDSGADVVQGPVVSVLPGDASEWMLKGGFYQRSLSATGKELPSAATNNTLLTRAAWERAGRPTFDPAFSSTGGSDWDLFWRIRKSGSRIHYYAGAVVSEDVPNSRLSWDWLRQRYIRNGIVEVRVRRKNGDDLTGFLGWALGTFVVGVGQAIGDVMLRRGRQARTMQRVYTSIGKFAGLLGYRIHEYRRKG